MKVSREILSLVSYKPGKPISETQREFGLSHVIKLASNENPLGPSPKASEAVRTHLLNLHRYPDSAFRLTQKIAKTWNVAAHNIALGNGSNEIIDILIRIYCEPGEKILTSQYSFIAYQICAQAARVATEFVNVRQDFTLDVDRMAEILQQDSGHTIRLVFIANPNNPTGVYSNATEIERFLGQVGRRENLLIVFDEAYTEFVRAKDYKSALEFQKQYPSVVVIRTMSKVYGLAGLRMGMIVADLPVIDLFNRVRTPFNTNEPAQIAAEAALGDTDFIQASQRVVWGGLDYYYEQLTLMGLPFVSSQGNFVFFDTQGPAARIYDALLRKGMILRPLADYKLPQHLRLTVGMPDETEAAIRGLKEVLKR
jgi:histidinol-phosphate aminotransferase